MNPPDSTSDQLLKVQGLFIEHLPALRAFVLSVVADMSMVDDIIQETFLVVSSKAHDFKLGSNFRAWLWTIARYKALQLLAKRTHQHASLSQEVIEALCAHETSETWFGEEHLAHLSACMEELAPKAREAIELRYKQNHKPPEIARHMAWTVDAVHVALSRARVVLRKCVERKISSSLKYG